MLEEQEEKGPSGEPKEIQGSVVISAGAPVAQFTGQLILAADVLVEESPILKSLRLRSGDFLVNKSVFLVVDGVKKEITDSETKSGESQ